MTSHAQRFARSLADMPLVAILRGLTCGEAEEVGAALVSSGVGILEVPLNSPDPFDSIRILSDTVGERAVIGGGTVVTADDVKRVADAGGQIAVAPNCDYSVIEAARRIGVVAVPGFATPSEAFRAIDAGAEFCKLFPANAFPTGYYPALKAVLPSHIAVLAVGGVGAENAGTYLAAGFSGVGVGSNLYKPGRSIAKLQATARALVAVCRDRQAR